jgi:hypothetical protein
VNGIQQLRFGHGFGQVIVCAQIHPRAHVRFFTPGGEKDERDRRRGFILAQCLQHSVAIQLRHHDVAQDEIGLFLACHRHPPPAILGGDGMKLLQAENRYQVPPHLRLILDHENLFHCLETILPVHRDGDKHAQASGVFALDPVFSLPGVSNSSKERYKKVSLDPSFLHP